MTERIPHKAIRRPMRTMPTTARSRTPAEAIEEAATLDSTDAGAAGDTGRCAWAQRARIRLTQPKPSSTGFTIHLQAQRRV